MSRISIKTKNDLPAELAPLWDKMTSYGAFENQAGVMAHRPPIFKHVWSLLVDLADEAVVSKRHLELALVTVSLLNKCTYCVSHHAPKLAIQGVSEQGAERLLDYQDHPELDPVDRLVVEYAIAVTNNWNKTRDEIFARLRQHFSEAQDRRGDGWRAVCSIVASAAYAAELAATGSIGEAPDIGFSFPRRLLRYKSRRTGRARGAGRIRQGANR